MHLENQIVAKGSMEVEDSSPVGYAKIANSLH